MTLSDAHFTAMVEAERWEEIEIMIGENMSPISPTTKTNDECSACGHAIPDCECGHPRVVVCAANRSKISNRIIAGARHWDSVMRAQVDWLTHPGGTKKMPAEWVGCEQGFIDQWGIFMSREEAYQVASNQGQIKYPSPCVVGTLYSEDLY